MTGRAYDSGDFPNMSEAELVRFAASVAGAPGAGAQAEMTRRNMRVAEEQIAATRELLEALVTLLKVTAQLNKTAQESAEQSKAMFDLASSELKIARIALGVTVLASIAGIVVSIMNA